MRRLVGRNVFCTLLIVSVATFAECGLLEMSQILWTKVVSGDLTKIGKLDPLRVPVVKVDQSEGDTSYRLILRNLEIVGLNESILENVRIVRGGLRSNLTEREASYVSYSDLRHVDSIRYRFHTMSREADVSNKELEAAISPAYRAAEIVPSRDNSRYRESRFGRLRQDPYRRRMFEQYNRQMTPRPDTATSESIRAPAGRQSTPENSQSFQRPSNVRPVYSQRERALEGYRVAFENAGEDAVDCEGTKDIRLTGNRKGNRQYEQQRGVNERRYTGRIENVEVSASEAIGSRSRSAADKKLRVPYNAERSFRSDFAPSGNVKPSKDQTTERSGYIDIIYADDRSNGSTKHFGNLAVDPRENRRVYGIEDVMKELRENTRFIIHNFTEGEALSKKNDVVEAAMQAKRLKDLIRYARDYQEQQGYYEEGMQLIYHYGRMGAENDSLSQDAEFNNTKRTKRAHTEKETEDDTMHVILRIRVPVLHVTSQYVLAGKIGKEMLHGSGLLAGNFSDLVGDFALELKKVDGELMIVRAARAKLSAGKKEIALQGIDEKGPVQIILDHGLMAAEAVAAMLADDFATKGLSEKIADSVIYKMYKDLPVN